MDELETVVDDLTTVDQKFQPLYVEKDGKFHLDVKVKGFKPEAEFTVVHGALRKERTDHAATKQKLTPFLALGNPDEVTAQLARIPELEIAAEGKMPDDKKIDKLVDARIVTRLAPVQRERDTFKTQVEEKDKIILGFQQKDKTRTIHDKVRVEATKAKIRPEAIEDALMLAERNLDVAEDGNVVTKEGLDVTAWFQDLQPKRPHWFADSVGGGAGGNTGGVGVGANPWTAENWNMTEQGRIHTANPSRAETLAKAAGTTIGGAKPALKRK